METSTLLVHSPLVGPSSWSAAARDLTRRGATVAVPDLTTVVDASPPRWQAIVDTVADAAAGLPGPIVVIGHSGAGAFLPAIGEALGAGLRWLVFVDAVVPPSSGAHRTPPALQGLLDQQTVDGRLRRWLEWWSADDVAQLLPDPTDRASLLGDMPQVPRSFYDEAVPVPDGWDRSGCAYVRLSEAYDAEFEDAGQRAWPRDSVDGSHLSIHTDAPRVVDTVMALIAAA